MYPADTLDVVGRFCGRVDFGVVLLSGEKTPNSLPEVLPREDPGEVMVG